MKRGQAKEKARKPPPDSVKRPAPPKGRDAETASPRRNKNPPLPPRVRLGSMTDLKPEPWGEGTEHDSERVDEIVYGVPPRRRHPGR